jgi:outer membrane protein TolC
LLRGLAAAALVLSLVVSPSPAALAQGLEVPIAAKHRTPEALPAGDQLELSLQRTIELALKNALDLEVSALSYERSLSGITSAFGAFDPLLWADGSFSRSESPVFSRFDASKAEQQKLNLGLSGATDWGLAYQVGVTNTRRDSEVVGFTLINPSLSSNLTFGVTQPLLRNFGKDVNRRLIVQARMGRDLAAWDFSQSVQNAVVTVENAYWDLVNALGNLKAKKEALDRAKDFNRITKIKIDVGALAPIDIVQTEVSIALREQEIIVAEGLIGDAHDRLKRILNVTNSAEWNRRIVPTDAPSAVPISVDIDKAIDQALSLRPEVKQQVLDIESKKLTLVYNRNQLKPRLDFTGSYGLGGVGATAALTECSIPGVSAAECTAAGGTVTTTNIDYVDALYQIRDRDYPSWSVGLVFSVPLGNRIAKGNAALAATDLELARTSLALLRQNVAVEVRSAARSLDTSYKTVVAARKSRELAERNLEAEQKKFENGMTTSFQVAQIQNDLTLAQSSEILALSSYLKAVTAWHKATGDILSVKGIELKELPVTMGPTPAEEGAVR